MRPRTTDPILVKLIEDYPVVFNGEKPWCSSNGYEHGWAVLIRELCDELTEILEVPGLVVMAQIKEKFAFLRWYMDWNRDIPRDEVKWERCQAAIARAEAKSGVTCETCGAAGTQRTGGWIKTLCDTCAEAR